jgi:tetraacyldisaccharide 4'-kinase
MVEHDVEIIYPRGRRWSRSWSPYLSPLLVPASWVYQSLTNAVRSTCSIDAGATPAGVMVISVGNLEVGGSGKTPLAMYLLERISARGGTPVYVSRAFRSVAERLNAATVVAPAGHGSVPLRPGIRYLDRRSPGLAREIGDEGAMIAARMPETALVFSRDKKRALYYAAEHLEATHVVLDDAFQSWGVPRDVDVVLLDAGRALMGSRLLPAGPLREPPEALERADILGFNGAGDSEALDRIAVGVFEFLGLRGRARKPYFGLGRSIQLVGAGDGRHVGPEGEYVAVSGLGHPESFETSLRSAGVDLTASLRYPDHHSFDQDDVDRVQKECGRIGTVRVIVSEKDWAKLRDLDCEGLEVVIARLRVEITSDDALEVLVGKKAAE